MESLDSLKKELVSTKNLQSIVSTMKVLAATNIKKFEKTTNSLLKYLDIINLGFQGILNKEYEILDYLDFVENMFSEINKNNISISIVIGSNQGLCGRFNDKITEFFIENNDFNKNYVITIGDRLDSIIKSKKIRIDNKFSIANSIDSIINLVYEITNIIDNFLKEKKLNKVFVFYTKYDNKSNGILTKKKLLPLEKTYFENLKKKQWPTNNVPFWRVDTKTLLSDLITQYLFVNIYSVIASSLTAEQRNRLMTLQSAEENIKDHLSETTLKYNQTRQTVITSELLDVISGFKLLKNSKK